MPNSPFPLLLISPHLLNIGHGYGSRLAHGISGGPPLLLVFANDGQNFSFSKRKIVWILKFVFFDIITLVDISLFCILYDCAKSLSLGDSFKKKRNRIIRKWKKNVALLIPP